MCCGSLVALLHHAHTRNTGRWAAPGTHETPHCCSDMPVEGTQPPPLHEPLEPVTAVLEQEFYRGDVLPCVEFDGAHFAYPAVAAADITTDAGGTAINGSSREDLLKAQEGGHPPRRLPSAHGEGDARA